MSPPPLSILDLSPIAAGRSATDALTASLDLAVHADALGYRRIWFAEHHLTPGVASTSPAVLAALAAERTQRIRVGSGAVLLKHTPPTVALEQFATIARLHPGRVDLGLGRAVVPPPDTDGTAGSATLCDAVERPGRLPSAHTADRVVDGVVIPGQPPVTFADPAFRARFELLNRVVGARAEIREYVDELRLVLDLLAGSDTVGDGDEVSSVVAAGAQLSVFAFASSGGASATAAGALGLPLAANYHVSPATVLDTVQAYRDAFRPGVLDQPYVVVSADVLAADDHATAHRLAGGFEAWVLSIRRRLGAIAYPTPQEAAGHTFDDGDRALLHDRTVTRAVGTADAVAADLAALATVTAADELLLTTITHDPAARLHSYELLAEAWGLGAAPQDHAVATTTLAS